MSDPVRGTWCTPKWLADALGEFDLDPCSNPRAHIKAQTRLMIENGEDGLTYPYANSLSYAVRTFINPPYDSVASWVTAYKYTDFTFLLRWDPSTKWFRSLIQHTRYVWFSQNGRINFDPPPGIDDSSATACHALYMRKPPSLAVQQLGLLLSIPRVVTHDPAG